MDQASVMHCLPKQKGQLACPRPARQVSLQRQQDRPASTALPSPALSPLRSTIPEKASSPSQTRHPDPQTHSSWACPPRAAGPRHLMEDFRLKEGSVFFWRKESSSQLNKRFCKSVVQESQAALRTHLFFWYMQSPSPISPASGWLLYALRRDISQEISALKLLNQV